MPQTPTPWEGWGTAGERRPRLGPGASGDDDPAWLSARQDTCGDFPKFAATNVSGDRRRWGRFEQTAGVLHLVHRLRTGGLDGPRALDALDAIRRAPARWSAWGADLGALPVGVGVCLFLQPVAANVLVAGVGSVIVAGLTALARRLPLLRPLLPVTAGFPVALLVLSLAQASLLTGPLRTIVATLAILLPGGLLVTGLSEIAAGAASAGTAGAVTAAVAATLVHWLPGGRFWQVLYLPAFWIVVPGSFGLLNTAQIEVGNGAHAVLAAVSAVFGVAIGTLIGSVISRIPRPALAPQRGGGG